MNLFIIDFPKFFEQPVIVFIVNVKVLQKRFHDRPKTKNPRLYFLDRALTLEKSREMYLHFCLSLCVLRSSLRFDKDFLDGLQQNGMFLINSKLYCSSFNNKWRHRVTAFVKNCGQPYDFIIDLTISVFQFRFMATFMRKLIKFGLFQLGFSRLCSWNAEKLLTGMSKSCKKNCHPNFLIFL